MTQDRPFYLNRVLAFWIAVDAALAQRGLPPLEYRQAKDWFASELSPEDAAEVIASGEARRAAGLAQGDQREASDA